MYVRHEPLYLVGRDRQPNNQLVQAFEYDLRIDLTLLTVDEPTLINARVSYPDPVRHQGY